ncbi:hypothetical protein EYZ11_004310 [Aspergillus tanneri]|uniref:Peptidoglycan recognition protein 1 n=1 Tax=Aspergillus tanneri TaxID=1220188 RepID=A0A4S3JL69_9EURO|nr:peptidoglycan recognition protein 1 [Aspergillus tanneri]KAA8651004.1 peptidoglycan recognition protein 1 [Aspergillus tanneri]THC96232.1 hypothetical protein EYZ11_004310 [Aspergillus tanneri]
MAGTSRAMTLLVTILAYLALIPSVAGMDFVSRKGWNARAPKEAYTPITNPKGVKVHYLGTMFTGRKHSECAAYMRSVQDEHMDDSPENYFDIAYSLAVCEHGYVYDGRGKGHRSGANGNQQLNNDHYAVLAFLAKYGVNKPTDDQIMGIQDAIAYLRRAGAGNEIKGHKDGYNTECPGKPLYKLVTDGSLEPGKLWDGGSHVVKKGEDLDGISKKYNVPKRHIITANGLKKPYDLKTGQKLTIPARGVPLGKNASANGESEGGSGDDKKMQPFPGAEWFKSKPKSAVVTAMGKRLVEEDCNRYSKDGPGAQWNDEHVASYKCWQKKLGFTGAAADGLPGKATWEVLKVPHTEAIGK